MMAAGLRCVCTSITSAWSASVRSPGLRVWAASAGVASSAQKRPTSSFLMSVLLGGCPSPTGRCGRAASPGNRTGKLLGARWLACKSAGAARARGRFVILVTERQATSAMPAPKFSRMADADVAIVGGGASGTLVAIQLLRQARPPFSIVLVERAGQIGRGVAYSTREPDHLLNVPAGKLSALPDVPDHFARWAGASERAFVPRARYGEYLERTLQESVARSPRGVSFTVR